MIYTYPRASTVAKFPTISLKVAKFQSVKNKAPCKRLSHICALSRPLPGSVGVVGAVAKLTYFAIKTVAPGNFLSPRGFSGRQCWEDGRCGNMADTDKKGGVLRGFPKPAWQAGFSGVWSKEKKQGTYFKIGQTYFKIQGTNFSGCLSGVFLKRTKNAAFRCCVLIAVFGHRFAAYVSGAAGRGITRKGRATLFGRKLLGEAARTRLCLP